MAKRKQLVSNRGQLVNLITKLEGTKKQATVNAMRQAFKRLVHLDVEARLSGKRSPLVMLAEEAGAKVKSVKKLVNSKRNLNRRKKTLRKKK